MIQNYFPVCITDIDNCRTDTFAYQIAAYYYYIHMIIYTIRRKDDKNKIRILFIFYNLSIISQVC